MTILLKNLLNEVEEKNPLQVQVYIDMDGVLVDMDKGFKKISGGYTPDNYKTNPEFGGDERLARKKFWQVIARTPNFWLNLEPMPDAKVLWEFVKENFKNPAPVILSAGQGATVTQEKTAWIRKHIDPNIKVIIASGGVKKPEYVIKYPPNQRVTHVLVDDMQRNISVWDNTSMHRVGILHTSAASSIDQLKQFLPESAA